MTATSTFTQLLNSDGWVVQSLSGCSCCPADSRCCSRGDVVTAVVGHDVPRLNSLGAALYV